MMSNPNVRRACSFLVLTLAVLASACDSSDPLALAGETVVVMGRVASVTSPAASGPAAADGSSSLAGIEVSVEGSTSHTVTDASGEFRIEVEAGEETIVLRFRRGDVDARIEIDGVTAGATIRIEVSLSDHGGTVIDRDDDGDEDFDGTATLVSLSGDALARTLRVEVDGDTGVIDVDIVEGSTTFDSEGDVATFAGLLAALDRTDVTVRIEGDGEVGEGGATIAAFVKVETDEHDGVPDDGPGGDDGPSLVDFDGVADSFTVSGTAPARSVRVVLTSSVEIHIFEDLTTFEAGADVTTFAGLLVALDRTDVSVRMEGDGEIQDNGDVVAVSVKVETDEHADSPDDDDAPGTEVEFKGSAVLVSVTGTAPNRTVRVRVSGEEHGDPMIWLVDLVEGATSFDESGDFHSVASVLTALSSEGGVGRLEGEGTLQGGVIVATTARAEID